MQDNSTTVRLWTLSESDLSPGGRSNVSPKLRTALWHTIGAILLAVALMAQPLAAAARFPAGTPGHTSPSSSHGGLSTSALPSTGAPTHSQYFASTGKTVTGDFLGAYQQFGLSRIGYPISGEQQEDGTTVQYFERVRMERHPELANKGYGVLFSRLGVEMTQGAQFATIAPFASTKSKVYMAQTGHSIAEPFLSYWRANGGVNLFGYPISEAVTQDGLKVQWFERARMEYHPEAARGGQTIQLTLLGTMAYAKSGKNTDQVKPNSAQAPAGQAAPTAPAAPAAQPDSVKLNDYENYLLKAINDQRAAAGLPAVQLTGLLTDLARSRSTDMATRNYFSHTTPEGSKFLDMMNSRGIPYKFAGEILARNNYPDDQAAHTAMDSYLNSAQHKAIILDDRYNQIGIGYSRSDEDSMHYFTVIFVQQ